ncbi:MAG TPA: PAS domain S-box protein [candidate division Zixibacteria bacterium]|nr:PAS domain S-box protein [candidate division Zixibacteria bacterium]
MMQKFDQKKKSAVRFTRIKPKFLILTAFVLALIFLAIIVVGIRENQHNMLRMLNREGSALIEAVFIASQNTIRATDLVDDLVTDNIVDAASLIDFDHAQGNLTPERLNNICQLLGFNRVDILDSSGTIELSNYVGAIGEAYDEEIRQRLPLSAIIQGKAGVGQFVLSGTEISEADQLVAAVSSETRPGAIVVFMNYQRLDFFNRRIGIGYMIQNIGNQPAIDYIFIQGAEGVMMSSRKLEPVLAMSSDTFLQEVFENEVELSRRLIFEGEEVLEVARRFETLDLPPGVLRVGLSLTGYNQVARNFKTQMAILGGILFLLTFLVVTIVMVNQSYRSVAVAYEQFKNITSNILGGIESAVVAVDSENRIILVNPKTERIFGLKGADIIGKDYDSIFPDDNFMIKELGGELEEAVIREISFTNQKGRQRTFLATSSQLVGRDEEFQGAVGIAYDITERKRLESQAKQAERLSELGTLAAGVAHEIRNPLNAIAIASQRLKSEFEVADDKEGFNNLATTIKTEIERLNAIIAEFLALARSGHLNKEKVNLRDFIEDSIALLHSEAAEQNIRIERELDGDIRVEIDPAEMKKVIVNLIRNSMEAIGGDGRIVIRSETENENVKISIEDTGRGIDPDKINEIFTPYFTTKEHGTGLGLSISHRIVADHNGNLSAENIEPEGARFIIELPLSV